ncbi:prenyltransferase [Streptomyces sp. NBC_01619]|uniref:tryptophan dimethylallyltransferase family protein n=1 Tax=Streptomyces sp. NBC_01619 TaxID=2975901 RepID=UPI00224E26CC|nr:tryptophan dimethylallyltransferase family protein [Streptomyces sp. NBC_01619]MCX4515789.1 prenyltransferase [Streptomyces sp. NBC_01619]
MDHHTAQHYAEILVESLGAAAHRPITLPPLSLSFLSDDHTPVEFSLSFQPGIVPTLRVLLEPGCAADNLAENGHSGLRVVRDMARRWDFATEKLDSLRDLFFPPSPQGPLTLWIALELRPGGIPRIKVYLNPAAAGPEHATRTLREALRRLGHPLAFAALPPADGYPFLALDLGDWEAPRVKVYLKHHGLSARDAGRLNRMSAGPDKKTVEEFFRITAGLSNSAPPADAADEPTLDRRPALSCHSFTEATTGAPSGFTLHIPVRDYVRNDREAHARAMALLARHGMNRAALNRALPATTSRLLEEDAGLIAYLALAHEQSRPPRVTTYISSEAYRRTPAIRRAHRDTNHGRA